MRYVNAREVLPEPLVRELQKVVPGGCLYVPRDGESRRRWGEASGYKDELERRNRQIREERAGGASIADLADRHGLSVHAIKKARSMIGQSRAKSHPRAACVEPVASRKNDIGIKYISKSPAPCMTPFNILIVGPNTMNIPSNM